jgi:hypothetical protein
MKREENLTTREKASARATLNLCNGSRALYWFMTGVVDSPRWNEGQEVPRKPKQGGIMGQTASYCSDCYNKVARSEDAAVKAAESEGKIPMTKQGSCTKCGKTAVVVYYE